MRRALLGLGFCLALALALGVDFRYGTSRLSVAGLTLRHWIVMPVAKSACAFDDTGGAPCGNSSFATGGAAGGGTTPTFVQGVLGAPLAGGAVTSLSATGSVVGVGNTVVGAMMATSPPLTLSDDKGNNYTIAESQTNADAEVLTCFYLTNVTNGPSTVTAGFGQGQSFLRITWVEYKNVAAVDVHVSNPQSAPGTGADALTSTNLTPTASGDLLWAAVNAQQGNASTLGAGEQFSAGTGETLRTHSVAGDDEAMATADKLLATTSPVAGTFTAANGTGVYATCALALTHS